MGCDRRWVVESAVECPVKMVFGQPGQNDDLQDQNPPEQLALARRSRRRVVGVVCHGDFTWSRRRAKSAKNRKMATNTKENGEFATNRVGLRKGQKASLRQNARRRCDILSGAASNGA